MMHPSIELKPVNPQIGYGVFATAFIPAGTIVYVKCSLDIEIAPDSPLLHDPAYKDILEKYSYTDSTGYLVLCWDLGKYVNHCCHFNTISTAYGCDIALRDIQPGEELTSEYALYTFDREMELICHYPDCRKRLTPQDFEHYWPLWDASAREAIDRLPEVEQPLLKYLDPQARADLQAFLDTHMGYRSLQHLRPDRGLP